MNKTFGIMSFGRGHTIICELSLLERGATMLRIPKACTIRNWGATHGLGELSAHGPTSKTVLDAIAFPCRVPADSIHIIYECSDKANVAGAKPPGMETQSHPTP